MTLDPDRRRPAPPHPGFDRREIDVDMDVCRWCASLVPASELQRTKHEEWDQRIAQRFLDLQAALETLHLARDLRELLPGASPPAAGGPPAGTTRPPAPATPASSPAGEGGPGGRQDAAGGAEDAGDAVQPAPTGTQDKAHAYEYDGGEDGHCRRCGGWPNDPRHQGTTTDPEQADLLTYEAELTDQGEP